MSDFFIEFTYWIAKSCNNNPFLVLGVIFIFFIQFNCLEVTLERLIWGERFLHWGDLLFVFLFVLWSVYGVCVCGHLKAMAE